MLEPDEVSAFWRDGYVVGRDAVTLDQLGALRERVAAWVEESRLHPGPFGEPTMDGKPRCDVARGHSGAHPALRRINNPSELSPAFEQVMRDAPMVDMVADLIGSDVKFHHCKVNLKLPGTDTAVGYHQDFAYTPHSNDDVVTALLMLDDMTADNGCLMVAPGSHRGPVYSLFDGDRFTGFISREEAGPLVEREVPVLGRAGDVCLMHTRLAHGSAPNRAARPRGLYICVYSAADAFPLARNPMPNRFEGDVVRGRETRHARLTEGVVELPRQPLRPSFFSVQEEAVDPG